MKKLIFVLIILLFGLSMTQAQSLSLTEGWTTNFNWGGTASTVKKIVWDSDSGIIINGKKEIGATRTSAVVKFSPNGTSMYAPSDTLNQSLSDLQFCTIGGKIFYNSSGTTSNTLVIRNATTGVLEREKYISSRMSFCGYSDSVIAVSSSSSAHVVVMNNNGDSSRAFALGYSLTQGFVSVKQKENNLWICGLYYSSGYSGFIEKRDLISGALVWRKNFVGAYTIYATIDTVGNAYVVSTYSGVDSVTKIGATGNTIWSKPLLSQQNLYVWDVVVDVKNQIVITGGVSNNAGYVTAHKMSSGDSVFAFPLLWNSANSNVITGVACDTSGNFYITGYDYISATTTCHVRKYHYDTLTGITVIGGENPTRFTLSQNYPNPFNPRTNIKFQIPTAKWVQLKIFDVLGKEVAMLVNQKLSAGTYVYQWDASGSPSGTYFCRMTADGFTETKKMTLIK